MSTPDAIVVGHLAKRFDRVDAVAGISFSVQRGEFFGFLGPNGAGKSTRPEQPSISSAWCRRPSGQGSWGLPRRPCRGH